MRNNQTYFSGIRHDVLSLLDNGHYERLLEIGGGAFETIAELNPNGIFDVWGVDIADNNKNANIKFIRGSFVDPVIYSRLPDNYFDIIIANDVIEHVADTETFLHICAKKLAPNGKILISVPNIQNIRTFYNIFIMRTFPRLSSGLFDKTHLRWFTKKDVLSAFSSDFSCLDVRIKSRLVPECLEKTYLAEIFGIHIVALFRKK